MSRVACLVRDLPYFSRGVRAGPVFSAPRVGIKRLPPNAAQLLARCGWSRGLARGSPDPGRQVPCSESPGFLTSLLRRPGLLDVIFYLNLIISPQTYLKSCAPPPRLSGVHGDGASATILPAGLGLGGCPGRLVFRPLFPSLRSIAATTGLLGHTPKPPGVGAAVRLSPRPDRPASYSLRLTSPQRCTGRELWGRGE